MLIALSLPLPAGKPGHHAEAAFRDGHRKPAPVQLQLPAERILGGGGSPWHHEQQTGRDQRGQIGASSQKHLVEDVNGWGKVGLKTKLTLWKATSVSQSTVSILETHKVLHSTGG